MSESRLPDDLLKSELQNGLSLVDISRKYDYDYRHLQRRKAKLLLQGWSPQHDMIHMVPDGYTAKGVSTLYGDDGKVKAQWVKSQATTASQNSEFLRTAIESMLEEIPKVSPLNIMKEHEINDNLLAVYPLGDPHIGMMAWGEECGENWDLKLAEAVFCDTFKKIVKRAPRCSNALIVNLGDFFHYDNLDGMTAAHGNILDRDGRYAKMVSIGIKIIRQMIETALEHHENVEVINVTGNHDEVGSLFLSICLSHVYENEPRVTINTSPALFHYKRFGKVLLGAHHGHKTKMDKLPGVMATDMSKDWGETYHRMWLTGHIHSDNKKEFPGCSVESFRTIAPPDEYATGGGWRSKRDTKVIIFDKELGEVERYTIPVFKLTEKDLNRKKL